MEITRETAQYVAKLSRLEIAESDMDSVCQGLSSILNYMDEINASIDTEAVAVTGGGASCRTRPDTAGQSMSRAMLLDNAPERTDEALVVPRVVE